MKHLMLLIPLLAAQPASGFTYWNDIRTSAPLPDGTVLVRTESDQGGGIENQLLCADAGVQEILLAGVADGPSTLEASVPGPVAARRYYGFRRSEGADIDLLAVRLADGTVPGRLDLTRLAEDPTGDESTGRAHLDLTECRISRDGTRLYAALSNAGGGFPVSSGLTFFSYLFGIKNPTTAAADTVFAMIHTVNVAGIIQPGLYQVNGTGVNDLVKIGNITAEVLPGEDTLLLSCLLSDLEANPVFRSWYDSMDPRLDVAGFSQRITLLGGAQETDRTPGAIWHLREVFVDPVAANQLPLLSDLTEPGPGPGAVISVVYDDPDGHCPVTAEVAFDGGVAYPLRPQSLDYGQPVTYVSQPDIPPLVSGGWSLLSARFSDDGLNVVELSRAVSAVGVAHSPRFALRIGPSPFSGRTGVAFDLDRSRPVRLSVHDVRGRRVATLVDGVLPAGPHRYEWTGCDDRGVRQPTGVYFCSLQGGGLDEVRRIVLLH